MWDDEIKNWTVQGRNDGEAYAFAFLPKIQQELNKVVQTCMIEKKLNRIDAIKWMRQNTGQTLAKLADEYNYMKYAMKDLSL